MQNNKRIYVYLLLVLTLTFIVYTPVLQGEYIRGWDDDQQILNNADVTNLSWQSFKNYFSTYYVASYQPLASLSFGVEFYLFGENPFVPHLVNLLLHILNVVLVYFLLAKLFPNRELVIWLITIVFAIHPLQTEVVGWISTRSTLLYSSFFLLAILSYIKFVNDYNKNIWQYLLVIFWFALALLTKSAAVTLPIVLLLIDYYFQRKYSLRLLLEKAPFFIGSVIIGLASIDSRKVLDSIGSFQDYYTFFEKLGLTSYTLVLYFWKSIYPSQLMTYYGYPMKLEEGESLSLIYLLSPVLLLILLVLIWLVYKRSSQKFRRDWLFGVGFFSINIGLVINFTPFGPTMWAERYMYLPILGIAICIALFFVELYKVKIIRTPLNVILVLLIFAMGVKSRLQANVWKSRISLWENAIQWTNAAYPYMELGKSYMDKGNVDKAIDYYNGGVKVNPFYPRIYYFRALAIKEKGDLDYAKVDLERVIKSDDSRKSLAFYQRGMIYEEQGMLDSARMDYDSASFIDPESEAGIRKRLLLGSGNNLVAGNQLLQNRFLKIQSRADSLTQAGQLDAALEVNENVLLLKPGDQTALLRKALILSNQGKFSEAIESLSMLIEVNENGERAYLLRAYAYAQINMPEEAVIDYSYVLDELKLRSGEVLYFRALSFQKMDEKESTCSDLKEAVALGYQAAISLFESYCR